MYRELDRHKTPREYLSGYQKAQKRKAKEAQENEIISKTPKLNNYFKSQTILSSEVPLQNDEQLSQSVHPCLSPCFILYSSYDRN